MPLFDKPIWLFLLFFPLLIYPQDKSKDSVKKTLDEVIIVSKNPISEKYSVTKIEKLDIYFNPLSNADPLKAIAILPASTNVNETANPTLRGGDADRSRVFVNGAPILNPVRNGQDNGLGNFSLFNTELIDKQYVYASNPPLNFGNSSAGLVEIETNKKLNEETIQISAALSNLGLLLNKKLKKDNFMQVYGNLQIPNAFISLNKSSLPYLTSFSTKDVGLNARFNINNKIALNSYNYYIDENYKYKNFTLNFSDNSNASQKRFFSINNVDYISGRSKIRFSSLLDFSDKKYIFGNIDSKSKYFQCFLSLNHKYVFQRHLTVQYGIDYSFSRYKYDELRPIFYYALGKESPIYYDTENIDFQYLEPFIYANYRLSNKFGFSSAIRKNISLNNIIKNFTSYQVSSYYEINNKNRFIFSLGNYNSYSTPNYYTHDISLLSSIQYALDYYHTTKKINISSAIYYKIDDGSYVNSFNGKYDKMKSFGVELALSYNITKYLSLGFSDLFLNQKIFLDNKEYNSSLNLKYLIKSQITFNNPKYFTASLAFTTRPGSYYTKVINTSYNYGANDFEPFYEDINSSNFHDYVRLDFTINRAFPINHHNLIVFASINNILNVKNPSYTYYNQDYSKSNLYYFQQRIIYFGLQFRLNNI